MDIEVLKGKEISRYQEQFIQMRMAFYREYPYLYSGNKEFERKYFNMFIANADSRLIVAKEEEEVVGMIIGMPLKATMEDIQKPFKEMERPVDSIYYLGDILVPKNHKGEGIGSALYEEFEGVVRGMKKYKEIDLYEIVRPTQHPRKPQDYKPLETFWEKRGYDLEADIRTQLSWKEIGEKQETPHSLIVYLKKVA